jgi:hypothetical protein
MAGVILDPTEAQTLTLCKERHALAFAAAAKRERAGEMLRSRSFPRGCLLDLAIVPAANLPASPNLQFSRVFTVMEQTLARFVSSARAPAAPQ